MIDVIETIETEDREICLNPNGTGMRPNRRSYWSKCKQVLLFSIAIFSLIYFLLSILISW